ncbi:protein SIEVE ELEMENT OCCLUSION B-like [Pistacia vera]|uniref:protein SIEVE ELEMENT OCCLUSION B-like n=1 Tax=Pistacia vera TaxID=55513 RepID=UPI001262CD1E|nr:protein SIEVE ELEMENT OCCLUSION B-like [Pistacia vera]
MYTQSHQDPVSVESQYDVVWIPVVDKSTEWNEARQQLFKNHQLNMPWYSVYHPFLINPAVFIYIQEVRHLNKKPILVVLDPQGKLVSNNAFHMLWIWGMQGFPFTRAREAELWKQQTWGIKLLADSINEDISNWIKEENYICLYGGENIDWIREFIATARKVAEATSIPLQILYVGKSNSNEEQVRKIVDTITVEKLSHSLQEYHQVWFFWQRLESMWHSKTQLGCTVENDPLLLEINTLLSFDKNHEGWAVFCRGTTMAVAKSETILQSLKDFDSWKTHVEDKDFVTALNHHLNQL